ncbi:hypothetical protein AWW66_21000 [Micromonospora rosaria]|uniref:Ig-like domain-containing protein n=1 Tax=Micromonospora rosaria TaxID=47874 RepID=A0A136PNN6_9ACTN|nr:hypothetical protein [Micromonospora rosaria]KXK60045.1 hypothetical protein AWW66_21000 [Micromonospora rosaria]
MTQRRTIRTALLALALMVAGLMVATGPAQAAATDSAQASTGASAGSGSFARVAYDPAKSSAATPKAATVTPITTKARTTDAPLPGFCTYNGNQGATAHVTCSIVVPATVYVFCSDGNYFYGYLPTPGIWALTATPCYATGYHLV